MSEGEFTLSRRSVLRGAGALAVAATVPAALAGCGNETPAPVIAADVTPKRGGRMRAAFIGGSNESANILKNTNTAIDYVRTRVAYDALVEIDSEGKLHYLLAESIEGNADGTKWTVRLRQGPEFTNGKKVTADDVLHTLRTHVQNKSSVSPLLMDIDLANATRVDERTLVLPTMRPHGFIDLMLTQGVFIFSAETTDLTKAIGTGPFIIERHQAGQGALLKRNDNYWGAANGGPYLDELELLSISDSDARLNALKAGQIDYAGSITLTAARAERENAAVKLIVPPKWEWANYGASVNRSKAPFTDPRISQALRYAVDREAMVRNVTLGFGELGNDLFGMHLPHYLTDLPQREYDPDKAKSLLAQAGVTNLTLNLRTSDYEYGLLEGAVAFAEHAKKAGITINLDKVPATDFFADPKVFIGNQFQSANRKPRPLALDVMFFYGTDALLPFTGLANATVDKIVESVRVAVTEDQRRTAIGDLHRYLHEEGGDIMWARAPVMGAGTPAVHGVKSLGYPSFPSFRDAFLA